jgi:hypothetical protein
MSQRIFTDRSRIEEFQRCERLRWLTYHENGMGITSTRKPLPLAVGGSVHVGLATLLEEAHPRDWEKPDVWAEIEDHAVKMALIDFAEYQAAIDIGDEQVEMTVALNAALEGQDAEIAGRIAQAAQKGRSEFDQYLYAEQSALVEGLVRAYARRKLRGLLEQYEVLEVEREGSWLLSSWITKEKAQSLDMVEYANDLEHDMELWFMSRPDALLLERESQQLYILSFKTAAKWDRRKAEDAKHDMQGLSEGVEVEKRLAEWWAAIHSGSSREKSITSDPSQEADYHTTQQMLEFLRSQPAPPRILGIRYEYMLKGERWTDDALGDRLGIAVRSQRSPLVRAYMNPGMTAGDEQWNVSWGYVKEDGSTSKLYYKNWKGAPVFEHLSTKEWIDRLDGSTMTVGEENREMGYASKAQATGFLEKHPLDELFPAPIIIYRNDDELRDWIEQVEAQEVRVAEAVAVVAAAKDEGEKRSLLNRHFIMHRRACEYPTTCQFVKLCFGGEEIRRTPLDSGLYTIRTANHPQEMENAPLAK